MIELVHGNLLEADAEALVNTVNTVGVMGKGIALQFRQAFPDNYEVYRRACDHEEVRPGRMLVVPVRALDNPRYIINFPTKRHWKGKARMEDIDAGLQDLVAVIRDLKLKSVAVPPLGCGNGGLEWSQVRPRIEAALGELAEVRVLLFTPEGAPEAERMKVATGRPNMTPARAAVLGLLQSYTMPGYRLTLLEIQKLVYLLQEAGEPFRLKFVPHKFGPYAENLNHVLQRLEGHYIRGYGDRSSANVGIRLIDEAIPDATGFLRSHPDTLRRFERVQTLINGFETPYGMELLATVHWVARQDLAVAADAQRVVDGVHQWNDRKRKTFRAEHIRVAWARLRDEGWI